MDILILAPEYPYPTNNGARRRILAFTRQLSAQHDVTLAAIKRRSKADVGKDESASDDLFRTIIVEVKRSPLVAAMMSIFSNRTYREVKFWSPEYQRTVDDLLENKVYDVVFLNFLTMAMYIEKWLEKQEQGASRPILVLDQHNIDEVVWERHILRSGNVFRKAYAELQKRRIKRLQKKWFRRFDLILSVSPDDVHITERYTDDQTDILLAPNGADLEYFLPQRRNGLSGTEPPIVVFGGAMDVAMNQDAAMWFTREILPIIQSEVPNARLMIVGRNPSSAIENLTQIPGVDIERDVPDIRDYYGRASVFVVPSRMGGGTKLKTLEAMAMALPIVSTTIGAQGIDVQDGRHLYVANDPKMFADRVVELLKDREKAQTMGNKARSHVRDRYGWTEIVAGVEAVLAARVAMKA
jgi:glycosyltransferase involved in cell wall biosynthesis